MPKSTMLAVALHGIKRISLEKFVISVSSCVTFCPLRNLFLDHAVPKSRPFLMVCGEFWLFVLKSYFFLK